MLASHNDGVIMTRTKPKNYEVKNGALRVSRQFDHFRSNEM